MVGTLACFIIILFVICRFLYEKSEPEFKEKKKRRDDSVDLTLVMRPD